jgi:hypothetical protein
MGGAAPASTDLRGGDALYRDEAAAAMRDALDELPAGMAGRQPARAEPPCSSSTNDSSPPFPEQLVRLDLVNPLLCVRLPGEA